MDVPWTMLDAEVAQAAGRLRSARAELFGGATAAERSTFLSAPLAAHRRVSCRDTFVELVERARATRDPLAAALSDWVYVLTLERVLWADTVRVALAWHDAIIDVEKPEPVRASARSLLGRVLAEPVAEPRRLWAQALARGAGHVEAAVRIREERQAEATRRLGVEQPERLEVPCDPADAVVAAAESVLDRTAAAFDPSGTWDTALAQALGRRAALGWPAHLTRRWLWELFGPSKLTEGLAIDLGPLPVALGASSFARALAAFGVAYAEADVPRAAPFSLSRPPFDLRRARRGALFAGLIADPVFCMRALGLSRERARDQAQHAARSLLISFRLDAARALFSIGTRRGMGGWSERHEELTARALGAPIAGQLAGVVPALSVQDATRFLGNLLSLADRRDLVERFDEDWFRSPHAAEALRQEQGTVAKTARTDAAALASALDALSALLSELFG